MRLHINSRHSQTVFYRSEPSQLSAESLESAIWSFWILQLRKSVVFKKMSFGAQNDLVTLKLSSKAAEVLKMCSKALLWLDRILKLFLVAQKLRNYYKCFSETFKYFKSCFCSETCFIWFILCVLVYCIWQYRKIFLFTTCRIYDNFVLIWLIRRR